MDLQPWNPWSELEKVEQEVDRLVLAALEKLGQGSAGRSISFVPVVDLVELEREYRLYVSLPGVLEEDIDITVEENVLIIRGERETPADLEKVERAQAVAHVRRWKYGYFERRIQFPDRLEGEDIHAAYEAGVLTVRIAKRP